MLVTNGKTLVYLASLCLEALVVGLTLAIALAFTVLIYPIGDDMMRAAIAGLVLGAMLHLGFELSRANTWYCRRGAACSSK